MSERRILVHGHMFKNAGSTLDWAIERSFGETFMDHRDNRPMRREGAAYLGPFLQQHPELQALSSHHLCYPLPQLPQTKIFPVYILRHPLARILSVYNFERRQVAHTPGARKAKELALPDYLRWRLSSDSPPVVRNYQTRYLSGTQRPSIQNLEPTTIDVAMAHMETAAIGLVEQFDESMVLIEAQLKPYFPTLDLAHVPQNVGHGKAVPEYLAELRQQVGPQLLAETIHANQYDLALYEAARARVAAAMSDVDDFAGDLADFRQRCDALVAENGD